MNNTAIVYVSPNPLPSYAATPNGTRPHECYVDPAFTGPDYEVGAGKTYPSINSTPAINTWTPGTIMRIWNTDTTGSNPSVFHEYYQVSKTGTATQPILICGVPDSHGNLPIIDGSNATGNPGISQYAAGYGILNVEIPAAGGPWQQTPSQATTAQYISFTGLHLRNGNPNLSASTPPRGGGSAVTYSAAMSCVRLQGQYIDISGNDVDNCGNGLFADDNVNNNWWNASQNVTVIGNHFHNNGFSGVSSCCVHQLYFQSYFGLMEGNRIDNMYPGGTGADIKWRGTAGIFRYNYLDGYPSGGSGPAIQLDLTDNQDGAPYVSFESYLNSGLWPYDSAGANMIAAYQEEQQQDFAYGNILAPDPDQAVLYNGDEPSAGMADRNGTLYFYSNTLGGAATVFETGNNAEDDSFLQQRVDARNNIVWPIGPNTVGFNSAMSLSRFQQIILSTTTNLFETGSISIAPPITGGTYTGPAGPVGWYAGGCDMPTCPWPLTLPFDTHIYGLSSANFLLTPTQPFDPTSYIPPSGSAAIAAGTSLNGVLATMPVRYNFNVSTNTLTPRQSPQTIGAEDPATNLQASTPTSSTPTFSPASGTYSSAQTVTISATTAPSATIYYTTNGTTPTTSSAIYSSPISVAASETVQAFCIAVASGESSASTRRVRQHTPFRSTSAATPSFSPAAGTYSSAQTVTISTTAPSATIYYTTNGATPTTSSTVYSGPIYGLSLENS